ncbi:MAG: hypothetical protein ACPIOQ_49970, partial [Promethearchaeia archaeon]
VVFGKAFSGMLALSTAPDEPPQFTTEAGRPNPWAAMVVILFLISVPTQLILINLSLAVNDALYHIPSFYVAWNLGSITAGAVVYEELSDMNLRQALMFGAGIVVLVLGIVLTNVSMAMKASAQFRMKTNLICALAMDAFHLCTVILSSYALKDESMAIHQKPDLERGTSQRQHTDKSDSLCRKRPPWHKSRSAILRVRAPVHLRTSASAASWTPP